MGALAALRLQLAWGANEALADVPQDRTSPPPPPRAGPAGRGQAWDLATSAASPGELREILATFDGCALRGTATNLVFADGNPKAGMVLIGEAPGAEEDRAGLPFVGPSGRLLDAMLGSIGLNREQVLITNVLPWRPPGNRTPTEHEIELCLPFLLRHLALLQPHHLLLLGGLATRVLTGSNQGIRRLRGRWVNVSIPGLARPLPALPTFHPAYLLRTPAAKREAWVDFLLLRRALDAELTNL